MRGTSGQDDAECTLVARRDELRLVRRGSLHPYLVVMEQGASLSRLVPIDRTLKVGRGLADLQIDEEGLSRRHAEFRISSDHGVEVVDLGSRNGTYVNGERVAGSRRLRDGDRVEVGRTTLLRVAFHEEAEAERQRRLYEEATRDGLTGVFNKRYFSEALGRETAYAHRHLHHLAVMVVDVDHFKRVNDTFGHLAGDHVLRDLAGVLRDAAGPADLVARWGGEEFGIIARDCDVEVARVRALNVKEQVADMRIEFEGTLIPLTVSIGVSVAAGSRLPTPERMIAAADANLYQAKRAGRNCVVVGGL